MGGLLTFFPLKRGGKLITGGGAYLMGGGGLEELQCSHKKKDVE